MKITFFEDGSETCKSETLFKLTEFLSDSSISHIAEAP